MSEVSPSGDPTPSTGPAPGPWAPPDPGVWSSTPGHPPHTGPTTPTPSAPPPSWGAQPPVAPAPWAYGQPWPYAPAARRRSGRAGVLIAATTVLVLVVCGGIGAATLIRYAQPPAPGGPVAGQPWAEPSYVDDESWADRPATTPSGAPGTVHVAYEVTGAGLVDLEYYDANGDFVQEAEVPLPWRLNLRVRTADRVMVLAHRYPADGPVSCRITVDGRTVEEVRGSQWGASCFG
ncbi:MmpS family transport accessory protein [Micromonospora sp. NPDC049366]|uniref:MmpS family transport accessory protein n=1 Tax=Micromonospora sp. NPDC049366 TaxID=3364271 RepID=UPI0037B6D603